MVTMPAIHIDGSIFLTYHYAIANNSAVSVSNNRSVVDTAAFSTTLLLLWILIAQRYGNGYL